MDLKIVRNLKCLARIGKLFQLASLFMSIVPVEKSLSSNYLYSPVSFPIQWSCPIYDAKWGKTTHTIHKGDFCSSAPGFKGKIDSVIPTCDKKIFPVVRFSLIKPYNMTYYVLCSVIMANGLDDPQNQKCIQTVIQSNRGRKITDWLVYYAHGLMSGRLKSAFSANGKNAFQQSDWLEQDAFFNQEEWYHSYRLFIKRLLTIRRDFLYFT